MQETILIIYLVVAIVLVGIILLQQGKGAEMGASFGAGGSNTVFGAAGSGNALTKATTILAILFFGIALSISYLNSAPTKAVDSVFEEAPVVEKTEIESALPDAEQTASGIEAELPPTDPTTNSIESEVVKATNGKETESVKPETATKVDDTNKKDDNQ